MGKAHDWELEKFRVKKQITINFGQIILKYLFAER